MHVASSQGPCGSCRCTQTQRCAAATTPDTPHSRTQQDTAGRSTTQQGAAHSSIAHHSTPPCRLEDAGLRCYPSVLCAGDACKRSSQTLWGSGERVACCNALQDRSNKHNKAKGTAVSCDAICIACFLGGWGAVKSLQQVTPPPHTHDHPHMQAVTSCAGATTYCVPATVTVSPKCHLIITF